ncbi:S8 family serine peptidase [Methylomonas sp. SURF-1]|uniref:S8 family serine peptidase n=1 Tax=Methylomonas aurea TaxID=2952224 RepID=A0ABT1UK47_9GAMM|nr:S8 family serine peptidase [Methylomonas sp. SURF-1]
MRIALIDTGVDTGHPDLQGQIRYSENTAPKPADQNWADLHGMAVAGVLAARPDNAIGIAGIAPEADV